MHEKKAAATPLVGPGGFPLVKSEKNCPYYEVYIIILGTEVFLTIPFQLISNQTRPTLPCLMALQWV